MTGATRNIAEKGHIRDPATDASGICGVIKGQHHFARGYKSWPKTFDDNSVNIKRGVWMGASI
jgi:hypothetical protein